MSSKLLKQIVEKKTHNTVKIEIYDSKKLPSIGLTASDTQLIASVMNGEKLDMTVSSAGNFGLFEPEIGISARPFLFSDFDDAWNFMDSEKVRNINKKLEAKNIVVLSHYDNGFRCVTTTIKPVYTVADMKGLKIRTPENQTVMKTMTLLGAVPYPLEFGKLKKALIAGEFDGQENPIPIIYNNQFYKCQKYLTLTNHSYDAMPLVINKAAWDKLSDSEKDILQKAAIEAQDHNRRLVRKQTYELVHELEKKGMTVIRPDLTEFRKAVQQ